MNKVPNVDHNYLRFDAENFLVFQDVKVRIPGMLVKIDLVLQLWIKQED